MPRYSEESLNGGGVSVLANPGRLRPSNYPRPPSECRWSEIVPPDAALTFAVVWNPEDDMVAFSGGEIEILQQLEEEEEEEEDSRFGYRMGYAAKRFPQSMAPSTRSSFFCEGDPELEQEPTSDSTTDTDEQESFFESASPRSPAAALHGPAYYQYLRSHPLPLPPTPEPEPKPKPLSTPMPMPMPMARARSLPLNTLPTTPPHTTGWRTGTFATPASDPRIPYQTSYTSPPRMMMEKRNSDDSWTYEPSLLSPSTSPISPVSQQPEWLSRPPEPTSPHSLKYFGRRLKKRRPSESSILPPTPPPKSTSAPALHASLQSKSSISVATSTSKGLLRKKSLKSMLSFGRLRQPSRTTESPGAQVAEENQEEWIWIHPI